MTVILGSHLAPSLMGRVWFNCNRVFSGFGFIFSNSRRVQGGFGYCYSHPDYILKILFYYFILYFIINNNNNYNVFNKYFIKINNFFYFF